MNEIRQKIMEAVINQFNSKGMKFTMDDISKELHISKKTIYKEFEKAGLPEPEFKVIRGEFRVTFRNNLYEEKHPESGRDMKESLIEFCRKPRTRKELIDFTGKSRFYTMSQWVQPLVEEGKLIMSVPEKPKSPNQLYTTSKDFSLETD